VDVERALRTRRSVRAFLPTEVPRAEIERLLALAARSASNSNVQPWHVHVLTGEPKRRLSAALLAAMATGQRHAEHELEYPYQPEPDAWIEPYRSRRHQFGESLYGGSLGIERTDTARRYAHHLRNYEFFGAPVGMVLTVGRCPLAGALLDAGLFLQALMLAAQEAGLATCPQASLIHLHPVLRSRLGVPADQLIVCGLALGYADPDHVLSRHRTPRAPVAEFTTFHQNADSGSCSRPA
jgi:nitroreductase